VHAVAARPGVVVIDGAMNMLASNSEAIQILTFPNTPDKIPHFEFWLADRIRSRLIDQRASGLGNVVPRFKSAKRTYVCRSFSLNAPGAPATSNSPRMLILLERNASSAITMAEICGRFGLTPREQETVKLLLQGLTSKEIAERMKISPNTVKAFIRLVMVKMNVSTRSGIIGKIAESNHTTT